VSCHPATLARDAKMLIDAGYRMRAVRTFDMFPHTHHIEAMALFEWDET
jgi:23S rRNA (uracil1939-C5)-methyltransferase